MRDFMEERRKQMIGYELAKTMDQWLGPPGTEYRDKIEEIY